MTVERVLARRNRGASAPASRWRSRRWRGWCGCSSRRCTATTRSCTTGSSSTGSAPRVVFVDDVDEVPDGAPLMLSAHGSAPDVVAHGPRARPVRRERGVPARHEGPPRGQGAGREGLHDPVRRPRRPRRSGRHARRRARRMRLVEHEDDLEHVLPERATTPRGRVAGPDDPRAPRLGRDHGRRRGEFPELWTASRDDLCFATTNRQAALTRSRQTADAVVVIGSANSSNTIALDEGGAEPPDARRRARRRAGRARPRRARPMPESSA